MMYFGVYDKATNVFWGTGNTQDEAMEDAIHQMYIERNSFMEEEAGCKTFHVEFASIAITEELLEAIEDLGGGLPWRNAEGKGDLK